MVELVVLTGGGHIASFRFAERGPNLLWEAPWTTTDPQAYREAKDAARFGKGAAGKFLSGFTGHALALGYFGMPSEAEAEAGLPLHGEAANSAWKIGKVHSTGSSALAILDARLPISGLCVEREIELRKGETFARIRESVSNLRKSVNFFQWVQHATFGEPLMAPKVSVLSIPGFRGKTWPLGYEGNELLASDQAFRWPVAPSAHGGSCDLRRAFHQDGKGYVASVLLDTTRESGFVTVFNPELRIAAGYSFSRKMFPWVAIWEENRARSGVPWKGVTRARGVEFGTSPMPLGLARAVFDGPVFETPTLTSLGIGESATAEYRLFAAEVPPNWEAVGDVRAEEDKMVLRGTHRSEVVRA
ncbi:MAG TPA: DUF4432 family protein [Terriglobales bacterium]